MRVKPYKGDDTRSFIDIYEGLRLILDPQLLTFILGGVSFVAGAAIKKYVELWVEDRFKRNRERPRPEPEALREDLCRWMAEVLRQAALAAQRSKEAGVKCNGARLSVSAPETQGRVFWLTYILEAPLGRVVPVEEDPDRFYQRWFNAFRHLVVPFIALAGSPTKIVVLGTLGAEAEWQVSDGRSHATMTCNGDIQNLSPEIASRFRKLLASNPPFALDSSTALLHWRLCPELSSRDVVPFVTLNDAGETLLCSRCIPSRDTPAA